MMDNMTSPSRTGVDELVGWLRGEIEADREIALGATERHWRPAGANSCQVYAPRDDGTSDRTIAWCRNGYDDDFANSRHIARHDPASVIARAEADLRILERHQPVEVWAGWDHLPAGHPGARQLLWLDCSHCVEDTSGGEGAAYDCRHSNRRWPCPDVQDLVSVYVDRPGFRPEWSA